MTVKYSKWQLKIPKGHKIYQSLPLYHPPKFTQIGEFGLKIYHLATLPALPMNECGARKILAEKLF
jgi:hypothetical protein